ncbi:MAG: hypothetical protein CHACPFDD_01798 [Phycisphaerae bacterium]|nr:hypothetical protein [Phycisphaerae bacterium]
MIASVVVPVLLSIAGQSGGWSHEVPRELLAMEQSRNIARGHVTWTYRDHENRRAKHYTSRFAGEDYIHVDRGDDDGVVFRGPTGEPMVGFSRPHWKATLLSGDKAWTHDGRYILADLEKRVVRASFIPDVRGIGLSPTQRLCLDAHEAVWMSGLHKGVTEFRVESEGPLAVVRARNTIGDGRTHEIAWWLDPNKNFAAVRTQELEDGRMIRETRIALAESGKVWFPERIACYRSDYRDGAEPWQELTVDTATFADSLPEKFDPSDIGLEVGMNVTDQIDRRSNLLWDGEKPVTGKEFADRERAGERITVGPNCRRAFASLDQLREAEVAAGLHEKDRGELCDPLTPRRSKLWEDYVKTFIKVYELDGGQIQRAWTIHKTCLEQAESYEKRRKSEIEAAEAEVGRLMSLAPDAKERLEKLGPAVRERTKLEEPIVRIFDEQLSPRLERLPTRAQRDAYPGVMKRIRETGK